MTYYTHTDQGLRPYQEDRYCNDFIIGNYRMYGVFDGHGGGQIAETCADVFPGVILQGMYNGGIDISCVLRNAFHSVDKFVECMGSTVSHVGSTAVVCLVSKNAIYFANAGDSLALIGYKNGTSEFFSMEHKVGLPSEIERIEEEGGKITYDDGCARINQTVNVARGIGDHFIKKYFICNPHIRSITQKTKLEEVNYILLASDGVWDVMRCNEINSIAHTSKTCEQFAKEIVETAKALGSMDNLTATVIDFTKFR